MISSLFVTAQDDFSIPGLDDKPVPTAAEETASAAAAESGEKTLIDLIGDINEGPSGRYLKPEFLTITFH